MTSAPTVPTELPPAMRLRRRAVRIPRGAGFVAMSAALLAFFFAAGAPTPLLPIYEREWGFAPSLLTIAFGVYAFALIASLLVAGSLSDHIGRRPVLIGALALELVSVVVLLLAPSIGWIIVGRILQGVATGVASSTFGAAIVELAPEGRKRLGAVMSSFATTAGLGIGALFSGLVALVFPAAATTTVWVVLIVLMAAGTVFAVLTPETTDSRPGAVASLVPRLAVPVAVRRLFGASVPSVVAGCLVTALFLGLGPTILSAVFGVTAPIVGGLVNFAMFGAATVIAGTTGGVHPHRLKAAGNIAIVVGGVALIAAVAVNAAGLVWVSAVVAGAGMGATFTGSIRGLVPEVAPHERALLLSAVFTVAYLVFGGSAIAAGFLATAVGVGVMTVGVGVVIVLVALLGIALSVGLLARRPRERA